MRQQLEVTDRELCLEDSIKQLQSTNKKLAQLTLEKERLTDTIISSIGHAHEGERSYEVGVWKVTCRTPFIYSLDKKMYESNDVYIPDEFNPIEQSFSYKVNKKECDYYMTVAPKSVRDGLLELITKKPGKASVAVNFNA